MFEGLIERVADFKGYAFRNVPGISEYIDPLDDLSDNPRDRAFGHALLSEQKEYDDLEVVIMRPFTRELALSGTSHANFVTRFSDGKRFNVWYGSLDMLTTVYETAYHFKKRITDMMTEINERVVSERKVYKVQVKGLLVDLRKKLDKFPGLVHKTDYSFTHAVGSYLYDNGQNGLLVESARYLDGINIAAFKPDILSNPRHENNLTYRWGLGDSVVRIERSRGRTWKILNIL